MNRQQSTMTIVDLREIAPSERRLMVFDAFERLLPGETLVLVHNHHSKPLFYLFLAESPRGFTWDYLEPAACCKQRLSSLRYRQEFKMDQR